MAARDSVAVAVSDRLGLKVLLAVLVLSVAVAVSLVLARKVRNAVTASLAVDVSDMEAVMTTMPESKYQPNEPLLVEFVPAYHVSVRSYARTPVMAR